MDKSQVVVGGERRDIQKDQPQVDSIRRLQKSNVNKWRATNALMWIVNALTMPSPSASTLVERTRYFNSCSPSRVFPYCGPSRSRFSKRDRFTPTPEPVFLAGRLCVGTGAARAASRAAASLFERARRWVSERGVPLGESVEPESVV